MPNIRTNPCLAAIDGVLKEYGIPYTVEMGGKHPRVIFNDADGSPRRIGFSATPSDHLAPKKAATEARKVLRAGFPAMFGINLESETMSAQSLRSNIVYKAAKAELDAAGIPFMLSQGSKHPALIFEVEGQRKVFRMPTRPHEGGTAVEGYRSQIRQMLRTPEKQAPQATPDVTEETLEVVKAPSLVPEDLALIDGVPRIHDLVLAEKLGFSRPRTIRQIIERNILTLQGFSSLPRHAAHSHECKSEGEADGYYLTKEQAVFVVMRSRTPAAEALQVAITAVFVAYAEGRLIQNPDAAPLTIPEVEKPDTSTAIAPASTSDLLAGDDAIQTIVELVAMQTRADMAAALRHSLPDLLRETLPGLLREVIDPVMMDSAAKAEAQAGAFKDELVGILSNLRVAPEAVSRPWSAPKIDDGQHDFAAANDPDETIIAPSTQVTEPTKPEPQEEEMVCILDAYAWSGVNAQVMRRASLASRLRHSLRRHFPDGGQPRVVPHMQIVYHHYPKTAFRKWFDAEGHDIIRNFVYLPMAAE